MRQICKLLAAALALCLATVAPAGAAPSAADFGMEPASDEARRLADWVTASGDSQGLAFVIVDKVQAKVFVFQPQGRLAGAAPALLGLGRGDHSVPGIGDRKLATIRPDERTTPAGRFLASKGRNLAEHDIVWVDYAAAISLHAVATANAKERRLQRLGTASPLDNRISYGCINVPAAFFEGVVKPAFTGASGVVYVLPEVLPLEQVFAGLAGPTSGPAVSR
jgi:hypothetical protein